MFAEELCPPEGHRCPDRQSTQNKKPLVVVSDCDSVAADSEEELQEHRLPQLEACLQCVSGHVRPSAGQYNLKSLIPKSKHCFLFGPRPSSEQKCEVRHQDKNIDTFQTSATIEERHGNFELLVGALLSCSLITCSRVFAQFGLGEKSSWSYGPETSRSHIKPTRR